MSSSSGLRVSQRQPTACKECSRRKVRCDKQIPCSRCVRLSKPCTRETVRISKSLNIHRDELHFLRYLREQLRSEGRASGSIADLERRIELLEHGGRLDNDTQSSVAGSGRESTATSEHSAEETDPAERDASDGLLSPLSTRPSDTQYEVEDQTTRPTTSEGPIVEVDSIQTDNASILTAFEFLAWGRHIKACYPHRSCSCYQQRRYSELASINSDPTWIGRRAFPVSVDPSLLLPAQSARKVVQFHLDHLHWHHNAFHGPTFLDKCEQFWQVGTVDHPLWMALYFAVSSVSLWTLLNNDSHRNALGVDFDESLVEMQFKEIFDILYKENFLENLSLYSIQAIVISTRIAHNLDRSDLNATLIGAAVRIAHCLGLHKIVDPLEGDDGEISSFNWYERIEVEVGKRAWQQLVIQDHFQIPFTDTYVVHPSQFATPLPRNCGDHDMVDKDHETATNSSYVRMLARSAAQIPPLLDGLGPMGSRKPVQSMYEHILACDKEMRASVQRIPKFLLRDSGSEGLTLPWISLARRTLAISAAEKIIMIHRPVLYFSFQTSAFAKTRTTCVAAATMILREHEQATAESVLSIWTHSAFSVTAAVVLGLELFHRTDHTDDTAHLHRQMLSKAAERLRNRRCDAIAKKGAILIDTMLAAEEDLVLRLMRTSRYGGSVESRQREVINEMIGSHEIMAKFLASTPDNANSVEMDQTMYMDQVSSTMDLHPSPDFDSWFNEVFAPTYGSML